MSLVGAHLDVVTANPDAWEFGKSVPKLTYS
jgi:hypothetical protein